MTVVALDFNHRRHADRPSVGEAINLLVDDAIVRAPREERTYLGASALGEECERRTQLDHVHANKLPHAPRPCSSFGAQTLRVFAAGHAFEDLAIGWLRAAGFDLRVRGSDGRQFGFSVADGRLRGHVDGVLVASPGSSGVSCPSLWEHKALGRKSWQEVVKHGVAKARPVYAAQIALYQAYLDLTGNPALFTATNRDTLELYHERVPFDGALAQLVSDRAVRILRAVEAGDLLPAAYASEDHYVCKSCRWREFCWGDGR